MRGPELPGLPSCNMQDRLHAQVFGARPGARLDSKAIRAGSNISLVWDASGVTVSSTGGSGSASLTAVTLNAPYCVQEWSETLADAAVTPSSKILVSWGAPSSSDENEPSMDSLNLSATPGSGTVTITAASDAGWFGGPLKLHYLVAA